MKKYTHKHVKWSEKIETHTFFLENEVGEMINNGGLGWVHSVFGKGMKWGRQWIVTKVRGKNWKSLKTDLFVQNTWFSWLSQVAIESLGLVARTFKTKILKNLSKCFSRLEVLPARDLQGKLRKFLSPLVTGPSTREQVAKLSREKH